MILSVVIPVYNEENIIEKNLINFKKKISRVLKNQKWQFIIIENGSSDRTLNILTKLQKKHKNIEIIKLKKSNYGKALKIGCINSNSKYVLVLNIDHLWDEIFFKWSWKFKSHFDVIIASKRSDPYLNSQTRYRKILSSALNLILNFFFDSVLADTHGMKLINLRNIKKVIKECKLSRGQFDTELMLKMSRFGYRIAEVPIPYIEKRSSRNFMFRKIFQNIIDLFELSKILKKNKIKKSIKYRRYSRDDLKKFYV